MEKYGTLNLKGEGEFELNKSNEPQCFHVIGKVPQFTIHIIEFQEKMSSQEIRRELREKRKQLFVEKRRYELETNDLFDEIEGLLGG